MKLLYFTDPHIRGNTPSNRKDVYYVTMLKKFWELGKVIKEQKIDFVIIGGDLFDTPTVSNRLLNLFAEAMKAWNVKIIIIPGNHDIFGQNIASLQHTSLGTLSSTGVVKIITRDISPYYIGKRSEPGNIISITGQEYYESIDTGNNDYEIEVGRDDAFKLLIAHGFVVEKPFHPDIPHTLISNIMSSADLILTGHYHPNTFDAVTPTGTKVLKPVGLGRLEATKYNINHKPQYLIFEVENCQLKNYVFKELESAPDGHDIFDEDAKAEEKEYRTTIANFTEAINNVDLSEQKTIYDMLREIAGNMQQVNINHLTTATNLLVESEKTIAKAELNGYMAEQSQVYITGIVLENFESHKHTEITLKAGTLSALVGPSNNGKTAIIRAINWCLFNEPSGNEFIRQGEKYALVTLKFSNGKWLTRRRTNSDSGSFVIYDEMTKLSTEYTKFSNAIPVEVFNASQMPKVSLGGKKKIALNYAQQLEGPFMLSMSSSERATAIGTITGTNIIDDAVGTISKDIINLQRSLKSLDTEIATKDSQIRSYDDLEEDKKQLETVQKIIARIHTLENEVATLDQVNTNYMATLNNIKQVEAEISSYDYIEVLGNLINVIDEAYGNYALLYSFSDNYTQTVAGIKQCDDLLHSIGDLNNATNLITRIENDCKEYNHLNTVCNQYSSVTFTISQIDLSIYNNLDEVAVLITELETLNNDTNVLITLNSKWQFIADNLSVINAQLSQCKTYNDADKLDALLYEYNELNCLLARYTDCKTNLTTIQGKIKQEELNRVNCVTRYKELLKEVGICPICASKLTADSVENLTL